MSTTQIIIIIVGLALVLFVSRIGYRRMTREQNMTETALQKAQDEHGDNSMEILCQVSYHGGLADKDAIKMRLALVDKALLLFDDLGYSITIPISRWKRQDAFIARQKSQNRFKSVVLLGPFALTFFRDKFRHVVTLDYIGDNGNEETLILETPDFHTYNMVQTALRVHREEYLAQYRRNTKDKGKIKADQEEKAKSKEMEKLKESIEKSAG